MENHGNDIYLLGKIIINYFIYNKVRAMSGSRNLNPKRNLMLRLLVTLLS